MVHYESNINFILGFLCFVIISMFSSVILGFLLVFLFGYMYLFYTKSSFDSENIVYIKEQRSFIQYVAIDML